MSHHKICFLFPGQGSQYVGMGKDFYEKFEVAQKVFDKADEVLGKSFSQLLFEGPMEELTLTKNSQPAIYVMSFAIYQVFSELYPNVTPYACAGLSLGEYTALAASGRISFEEGLRLVAKRASLMQEACEISSGSMRVVLGSEESFVASVLSSLQGKDVCIANINCPGQIVIAGTKVGLEEASLKLKEAGAKRILPLEVSGAFHSNLMLPAKEGLTPFLLEAHLKDTPVRFVMNTVGGFVEDLQKIRENLIDQVTEPVYWQKGIEEMEREGATHFIEMGCGKTLQGMNKRIGVKAPTCSIEKVEELANIEEFLHVTT
ncbi:MAG: ACP S-malonyltransferase [Chlamydiota bacterium]